MSEFNPMYIPDILEKRPGTVVTAQDWNAAMSLFRTQGNNNTSALAELATSISELAETVQENIGRLDHDIADLRGDLEDTQGDLTTLNGEVTALSRIVDGLPDRITALDTNKMDKNNPTGTGSFKMNGASGFVDGNNITVLGTNSHAYGDSAIAGGYNACANGDYSVALGHYAVVANGATGGVALGKSGVTADHATAEGYETLATAPYQHVMGKYNAEDVSKALIIGNGTSLSSRSNVFTVGFSGDINASGGIEFPGALSMNRKNRTTVGLKSTTLGNNNEASGDYSTAEGSNTTASGMYSHAENSRTTASGMYSHAQGFSNFASGQVSHAEGESTVASGRWSHAQGLNTIAASDFQHAAGKYNVADTNRTYARITGNGTDTEHRSNAETLDWLGNFWVAGNVTDGNGNVLAAKADSTELSAGLGTKQDLLVSGANIKTINNQSILGSGNIDIQGGSGTDKMDKVNPVGTGSLSMNRLGGSTVGAYSVTLGGGEDVSRTFWGEEKQITFVSQDTANHTVSFKTNATSLAVGATNQRIVISDGTNEYTLPIMSQTWDSTSPVGYVMVLDNSAHDYLFDAQTTYTAEKSYGSWKCIATAECSLAAGRGAQATRHSAIALGDGAIASEMTAVALNQGKASGASALAANYSKASALGATSFNTSEASGLYSNAFGSYTTASGHSAHSEGNTTIASGPSSHAEGFNTKAQGNNSHAEGNGSQANQTNAHAEGLSTKATGYHSHAQGEWTESTGEASHVEGYYCKSRAIGSHSEGMHCEATHNASHAEGNKSQAKAKAAHAEGSYCLASSDNQHVSGTYNVEDSQGVYAVIVGNGTANNARSNAYTLDWSGNLTVAGEITDGYGNLLSQAGQGGLNKMDKVNPTGTGYVQLGTGASASSQYGTDSFAIGTDAKAYGMGSFVIGKGSQTYEGGQVIFGPYNADDNTAELIIACGGADNDRKNLLTFEYGTDDAHFAAEVTDGNGNTLSSKQDLLVSGTNIKTINNTSILGSGNINISAVQTDIVWEGTAIAHTGNFVVDFTAGGTDTFPFEDGDYFQFVYNDDRTSEMIRYDSTKDTNNTPLSLGCVSDGYIYDMNFYYHQRYNASGHGIYIDTVHKYTAYAGSSDNLNYTGPFAVCKIIRYRNIQ